MIDDSTRPHLPPGSRVIAHRGGAANAPENTLAALREAARTGVTWVEVDVSLLGDGTAVLFHDDTLDRCTDGSGRLVDCAFADLERLDAGRWFAADFAGERVPTLAQAIAEAEELGLSFNLELKVHKYESEALVRSVVRVFEDSRFPPERTFVSCLDHASIELLHGLHPPVPRGLLFGVLTRCWQRAVERCRATSIIVDHQRVGVAEIADIRAAGCDAYVYTVNEPTRIDALWGAGLTGVITDQPQNFLAR